MPIATADAHGSSSRRRRAETPDDEDGSADERRRKPAVNGELWTPAGFRDQPIRLDANTKLAFRQLQTQVEGLKEKVGESIRHTTEAAKAFEEASHEGSNDETIEGLARGVMRAIEQQHLLDIRLDALKQVEGMLADEAQDITGAYLAICEREEQEYMSKSERQKFKDDPAYADFRLAIWEINHQTKGCPPVTHWLARDDADGSDDEVELGGVTQTYRCPITMRPYEDACKNTECGHHYSYAAIMSMFKGVKRGRPPPRCPVAGCQKVVSAETLERDPKMQRRAEEYERRLATQTQADREADFDVDDDDE